MAVTVVATQIVHALAVRRVSLQYCEVVLDDLGLRYGQLHVLVGFTECEIIDGYQF